MESFLLTTLAIRSPEAAVQCLRWYCLRWRILLMTLLGRATPALPEGVLFSELELRVLQPYAKETADGLHAAGRGRAAGGTATPNSNSSVKGSGSERNDHRPASLMGEGQG